MSDLAAHVEPAPTNPMAPTAYRVRDRVVENRDSVTLSLEPVGDALATPKPGEFMMMYAFGIGEVAISVSGDPMLGSVSTAVTHNARTPVIVARRH